MIAKYMRIVFALKGGWWSWRAFDAGKNWISLHKLED